jgi:hypothetical protein
MHLEVTQKALKEREKRKNSFCFFSVFCGTFAFFAFPQTC